MVLRHSSALSCEIRMLKAIEQSIVSNKVALLTLRGASHRSGYDHLIDIFQQLGSNLQLQTFLARATTQHLERHNLRYDRAILGGNYEFGALVRFAIRHCQEYCYDSKNHFFHHSVFSFLYFGTNVAKIYQKNNRPDHKNRGD